MHIYMHVCETVIVIGNGVGVQTLDDDFTSRKCPQEKHESISS